MRRDMADAFAELERRIPGNYGSIEATVSRGPSNSRRHPPYLELERCFGHVQAEWLWDAGLGIDHPLLCYRVANVVSRLLENLVSSSIFTFSRTEADQIGPYSVS